MLEAQTQITKFKANPPKAKTTPRAQSVTKAKKTILAPSTNGKRTETRKHARGGKVTSLARIERLSSEEK